MITLLFALTACESDFTVARTNDVAPPVETSGSIVGRVCDPSAFIWLEGAPVYAPLALSHSQLAATPHARLVHVSPRPHPHSPLTPLARNTPPPPPSDRPPPRRTSRPL